MKTHQKSAIRFAELGNCQTSLSSKDICTATKKNVLLLIKSTHYLVIFCTIQSVIKIFKNFVDKGNFSWAYYPILFMLDKN